jgi:RNA polymerase sigma-70 factor (ECF subfamily)
MAHSNGLNPEQWVRNYGDRLFNYALGRVKDANLAKDLVQETLLTGLRNRAKFRGESTESTWLFAILRNKIADHFRKVIRESPPDELPEDADAWFDSKGHWREGKQPDNWARPGKDLETSELRAAIEACLAGLPGRQAAVFRLKMLEEYDTEAIRKELGISASNYWVMMHRAKLKLRDCLSRLL